MSDFDWMSSTADRGTRPLDVQSRGRELTQAETKFAQALEEIFSQECHDMAAVAEKLNEQQIESPTGGAILWSVESLATELATINAQLDAAFEEHGYGA